MPPHYEHESALRAAKYHHVAGVDEAGRGPLAGPVAAAAVILDPRDLPRDLDDSKKLTARARDELFVLISRKAVAMSVSLASVEEIDRLNIRAATLLAMRRALAALSVRPSHALIDGNAAPADCCCPITTVIGGDALCLSIAAASIVAKVTRDRLMQRLHHVYPLYGFDRHAGYATLDHRNALAAHGPASCHRKSFAPVKALGARL